MYPYTIAILCNICDTRKKLSSRTVRYPRDDWTSETEMPLVSIQIDSCGQNEESDVKLLGAM